MRAIENNEVSELYLYDKARLARNVTERARVFLLCIEHGTTVVTDNGNVVDYQTAAGIMIENFEAAVDQNVADKARERSNDLIALPQGAG